MTFGSSIPLVGSGAAGGGSACCRAASLIEFLVANGVRVVVERSVQGVEERIAATGLPESVLPWVVQERADVREPPTKADTKKNCYHAAQHEAEAQPHVGDAEHQSPEATTANGMMTIRKMIFHFGVRFIHRGLVSALGEAARSQPGSRATTMGFITVSKGV